MKRSDSTEMDRLLRRLGRREGDSLRAGAGGDLLDANGGPHMDADELSAFAEGALPEAARARYVAHLADCDACRKLVTGLTLAAGASGGAEARAAMPSPAPGRSWRDWLAAIFSPPVLRFGVPALALFAVIIIAVVATRTQRDAASVAQRQQYVRESQPQSGAGASTGASNSTSVAPAENHANTGIMAPGEQASQPLPAATPAPPQPAKTATEQDETPAPAADSAKPAVGQTAGKSETVVTDATTAAAPAAPTAAPPPVLATEPAPGARDRDRVEEQRKDKAAAREDDERPRASSNAAAGGAPVPQKEAKEGIRQARRPMTGRTIQELPTSGRSATPGGAAAKAPAENEDYGSATRSVGGRRFRREGNAWVDTAYNSSLPTTNVARGSEQYRALVADEPGLRSITQQLGGQVVVVWKSRAYRFY